MDSIYYLNDATQTNNVLFLSALGMLVMAFVACCDICDSTPTVSMKMYDALLEKCKTLEEKNEKDVADYNALVDEYNDLLDERDELQKSREKDVDDYNKLVDRHNALFDENEELESRIARLESRLNRNFHYRD